MTTQTPHPSEPERYPLTFNGEKIGFAYADTNGQLQAVITNGAAAKRLRLIETTVSISIQEPTK